MNRNRIHIKAISHALLALLCGASLSSQAVSEQPNVVIIYGDDVGYGDVGAYGSKQIPTPHIDALAAGQ